MPKYGDRETGSSPPPSALRQKKYDMQFEGPDVTGGRKFDGADEDAD